MRRVASNCRCIVLLRFGHGIVLPLEDFSSSSFSNFHCLHLASPHSLSMLSMVTTVTETKICAMWRILCQFLVVFGDLLFRQKLERSRNAKNSWRPETGTVTSTNFFSILFSVSFSIRSATWRKIWAKWCSIQQAWASYGTPTPNVPM